MDRINQRMTDEFNGIARKLGIGYSQPSYRYWHGSDAKHAKDQYLHTTGKINHKGKQRYVAGVYRFLKSKNQYKLIVIRGFAKKKTAKARAFQWRQEGR